MTNSGQIKAIIKFIYSIKPHIKKIPNALVFSSKQKCENKILVLSGNTDERIYDYINEAIDRKVKAVIVPSDILPVSYTHLTLPTILLV